MKKFILLLCMCLTLFLACGCNVSVKTDDTTPTPTEEKERNVLLIQEFAAHKIAEITIDVIQDNEYTYEYYENPQIVYINSFTEDGTLYIGVSCVARYVFIDKTYNNKVREDCYKIKGYRYTYAEYLEWLEARG